MTHTPTVNLEIPKLDPRTGLFGWAGDMMAELVKLSDEEVSPRVKLYLLRAQAELAYRSGMSLLG